MYTYIYWLFATNKSVIQQTYELHHETHIIPTQQKKQHICSMYGIFTYIYNKFKPNVGKIFINIPYMEHMGYAVIQTWISFVLGPAGSKQ